MGSFIDLTGQRFGRLTVLERGPNLRNATRWYCLCACGNKTLSHSSSIRSLKTQSCGCLGYENIIKSRVTHGLASRKGKYRSTYKVWWSMMSRCNNPKYQNYDIYGGRGINVCKEWHSVENFIADMGTKPSSLSLDRIDNNKGYSKENCRWATEVVQCNNRRTTKFLTVRGVTLSMADWCRNIGMPYQALRGRLSRGWSTEDAIYTPSRNTR